MAVSQKWSYGAVEWFVLNESGIAEDADVARCWKEWCAEPGNRAEYVSLLQLVQDVRQLPAPSGVSWKELLEDIAVGEGDAAISRTG